MLGVEAMYNVDQLVVNSYFQPELKLQCQSISAVDLLQIGIEV